MCGPARDFMGVAMQAMGECSGGALQVYQDWAVYGMMEAFHITLRKLSDAEVLRRCRFLPPDSISVSPADPMLQEEEDDMAKWLFLLAREVVAVRAISMFEYSDTPPMLFSLILHQDAEIAREAIQRLQVIWGSLQAIERLGWKDNWFATLADNLVWPGMTMVRGIFVSLEEARWAVTDPVAARVRRLFGGILHTKPVEELFNYIGDSSVKAKSKGLGRLRMWHLAQASPILEQWGFETIKRTATMPQPLRSSPGIFASQMRRSSAWAGRP